MRENRFFWLSFLAVPFLLLWIHVYFVKTVDDYDNAINTDPDYAYLLSSIDISNLQESKMTLHPGTTLQVMSNLIMRCTYLFSGSSEGDFRISVIRKPTFYLNVLQSTFASLNVIIVFAMGILAYSITKKVLVSLLIQFTPLLSSQIIIFGFRRVTADILLISISLIMALTLFKKAHTDTDNGKAHLYSIFLGFISGFGAATKIPFISLMFIPLIVLPSFAAKIVYITSTIVSGLIFTLPITSKYYSIYAFLDRIFTHTGLYGRGKEAIIDIGQYMLNLSQMTADNLPFFIILFSSIVIIMLTLISPATRKSAIKNTPFRLLFSITLAQLLGTIVFAKHYQPQYLLPLLCQSGLAIYLLCMHVTWIYRQIKGLSASPKKTGLKLIHAFITLFLAYSFIDTMNGMWHSHHTQSLKLKESIQIQKKIETELSDYGIVHYYGGSSVMFGLQFGNGWTPLYTDALRKLYGEMYFYQHLRRFFYVWSKRYRVSLEQVKAKHDNKIVLVGSPFHQFGKHIRMPDFPLQDVFGGEYVTIYKVIDDKEG